ncbi:hypothetical protein SDC9_157336 [bioreactor metagenome]|uniref:Uncharacterized protein n=1 Tax=bioreactor metagenome TaxID=1076179 RepID=A0A645FCF4_9ZZZZ
MQPLTLHLRRRLNEAQHLREHTLLFGSYAYEPQFLRDRVSAALLVGHEPLCPILGVEGDGEHLHVAALFIIQGKKVLNAVAQLREVVYVCRHILVISETVDGPGDSQNDEHKGHKRAQRHYRRSFEFSFAMFHEESSLPRTRNLYFE